jgi:hypothetical protein
MAEPIVKPKRAQKLEVSAGADVVIGNLDAQERAEVEAALVSAETVLALPITARVPGPRGTLHAARVTPRLRLIYLHRGDVVEVADLLNAQVLAHHETSSGA